MNLLLNSFLFHSLYYFGQVLKKGGTEPPTKPKGRPKKNCFIYPDKFSEGRPVIEEIDLSEASNYNES